MKTTSLIRPGRLLLPAFLLVSAAAPTFAQTAALTPVVAQTNAAYFAEKPMADKGYWRLHVDDATNTTLIDFYGRDHALVYQEAIPNQSVLLTPQNRQLLNEVTERLTNSRLLASAATVTGLDELPPATESVATVLTAYEMANRTGFRVNSYITPAGVLQVRWNNPDRDEVKVLLLNAEERPLYNERSSVDEFRRGYNLSRLDEGTYTLVVTHNHKPHTFRVSLRQPESGPHRVEQKTPRTLASVLVDGK